MQILGQSGGLDIEELRCLIAINTCHTVEDQGGDHVVLGNGYKVEFQSSPHVKELKLGAHTSKPPFNTNPGTVNLLVEAEFILCEIVASEWG